MRVKNILTLILAFLALNAWSQKELKTGLITYEITNVSASDEQTAMMLQMMKGSQTVVGFDGDNNYMEMSFMGGMVSIKNYKTAKESNMLMDMMGQKMWIPIPENSDNKKITSEDIVVEADKSNTKKILGYDCYQVTVKNKSNPNMAIKGYITESIKTSANVIQGFSDVKFDGLPLEYTTDGEINITMTAIDIKEKVDPSNFTPKTEGYTKMTYEEFIQQMGPMAEMLKF